MMERNYLKFKCKTTKFSREYELVITRKWECAIAGRLVLHSQLFLPYNFPLIYSLKNTVRNETALNLRFSRNNFLKRIFLRFFILCRFFSSIHSGEKKLFNLFGYIKSGKQHETFRFLCLCNPKIFFTQVSKENYLRGALLQSPVDYIP